jgi:isorenieratene synthase
VARFWWDDEPAATGHYAEAGIFGGDFTGDNVFWLPRIQRESAFAEWAQATGGSACEVHVYGPADVLEQPDAAILARLAIDLRRAYPALRHAQLLRTTLQRNPPTHTLFNVGSTSRHLEVEAPWDGLWLAGDWIRYPSPALFLERATVTGIAAANGALRDLGLDTRWPILAPEPPEAMARGMGAFWRLLDRR